MRVREFVIVTVVCLLLGLNLLVGFGCSREEKAPPPPSGSGNPVTAPVDYLGAVAKGHQSALKTVGTASLDQAIKLFLEQEERYPTNLNELVTSGVLPQLPAPPNGMRFDYDPATGRVKVVAK